MRKIISFLLFAIMIALLISCGGTRKCHTSIEKEFNRSYFNPNRSNLIIINNQPKAVLANLARTVFIFT